MLKAIRLILSLGLILGQLALAPTASADSLDLCRVPASTSQTVSLGFPRIAGIAVVSTADFLDYVTLEYSLQEILLTSTGVPVTMLKISETPRPIVFNGYSPLPTQPRDNDLRMQLALFSPGINLLDVLFYRSKGIMP